MTNSACLSFPDSPEQCDTITTVRKVSGSLSFVGCVFMIFFIWLFRRYVVFAQRMILYLAISALLDSIAFLMSSTIEDGSLCDFMGWWATFFHWQVMLWVSCITFNLFMNVIRQTPSAKFEWLYIAICWIIPLIISCLPFAGNVYGPAGSWCWIVGHLSWRIGIWYAPLFICIITLIVTYSYIIYTLKKKASSWEGTYDPDTERQHRLLEEDIKPLRMYPFIYLAVSIFPLINRIQNAIHPDNHVFALVIIASITSALQGALNAIAFGFDKELLSKLRPAQIKIAMQAKFARPAPVLEYVMQEQNVE